MCIYLEIILKKHFIWNVHYSTTPQCEGLFFILFQHDLAEWDASISGANLRVTGDSVHHTPCNSSSFSTFTLLYLRNTIRSTIRYLALVLIESWTNESPSIPNFSVIFCITEYHGLIFYNMSPFVKRVLITYMMKCVHISLDPLPWSSVHWLTQCTLECHWNATGWPSVHCNTTGKT